jgi:hypothetical protein
VNPFAGRGYRPERARGEGRRAGPAWASAQGRLGPANREGGAGRDHDRDIPAPGTAAVRWPPTTSGRFRS